MFLVDAICNSCDTIVKDLDKHSDKFICPYCGDVLEILISSPKRISISANSGEVRDTGISWTDENGKEQYRRMPHLEHA